MANLKVPVWNPTTGRLELPDSTVNDYLFSKPATFDLAVTFSSTVNGYTLSDWATKLDNISVTVAVDLDTFKTKLDHISVSQAVDLDQMELDIASLTAAVVLKGTWDASTLLFPSSTKAGESWICTVAGAVGGISFAVNDRIVALVDSASTSSYGDWHKLDYTDEVQSVAGKTGAVTLVETDITDLQSYLLSTNIDSLAKLNAIVGESLMTQAELGTFVLSADWDVGDFQIYMGHLKLRNQTTPPIHEPGHMYYQSALGGSFHLHVEDSDIDLTIGEEEWITVRNDTGVTIPDGTPVYISGYSGGLPQVAPMIANGNRLIGIVTHDIETATIGKATRGGKLTGPDFTSFAVGDTLYVSPTVAGQLQNTIPDWPDTAIEVGSVMDNSNPGSLNVDIEHHGDQAIAVKSYNFSARTAASGEYFLGGFYEHADADANLTQASTTQVFGTANAPYGAHAFMVFGAGATDGTNITLTVTGASISAGVVTPADSEVLYTGTVAGLTLNDYIETVKKWVGQVTYTLTSDGVNFSLDFNYGLCKYEDFNNTDIIIRHVECTGLADAADAGFDIEFIHHKATGWTYAATGFHAGSTEESFGNDYGVYSDLVAGENFAWKRSDLILSVGSSGMEGVLFRITTSVNNSVAYMSGHIGGVISK